MVFLASSDANRKIVLDVSGNGSHYTPKSVNKNSGLNAAGFWRSHI
jgi:hypothetical protein